LTHSLDVSSTCPDTGRSGQREFFGSSGRTRTYNPSVNSRTACRPRCIATTRLKRAQIRFSGKLRGLWGYSLGIELRSRELLRSGIERGHSPRRAHSMVPWSLRGVFHPRALLATFRAYSLEDETLLSAGRSHFAQAKGGGSRGQGCEGARVALISGLETFVATSVC
jgi:hypothetical protein